MDNRRVLERVNFLRDNQGLAEQELDKAKNYKPNCHGTIAYLLGAEEIFRDLSQKNQDFIYVEGIPPCAGRDLMKTFLETECELVKDNYKFGDIVSLWSRVRRVTADMPEPKTREDMLKLLNLPPVKTIEHSAVLISPEDETIFHQQETGEKFEFNTIDKYISQWFPDFRGRNINLFVDFYRLR